MKVRRFIVTPELILAVLSLKLSDLEPLEFCKDPIPTTAEVLRVELNERGDLVFFITDDSFSDVPDGEEIPFLKPWYTRKVILAPIKDITSSELGQ